MDCENFYLFYNTEFYIVYFFVGSIEFITRKMVEQGKRAK